MGHSRWFMMRRFINWFPLGMTYSFLYMGRYNLNVSKNALGDLMSKEDLGLIFAAGTVTYAVSFLVNGPLVDKIGGKKGILIAAIGSSVANVLLGVLTYFVVLGRLKVNMVGSVTHLGEKPQIAQLIGAIKVMLDAYTEGHVDRLSLAYNDFVNTMTQKATVTPLPPSAEMVTTHAWDYLYEPDAESVLEHVLTRYVESLVYQAALENLASEHAARMVAMKSASDNATNAIDSLTLIYNKARQAAITQEISEIVSGAAAV